MAHSVQWCVQEYKYIKHAYLNQKDVGKATLLVRSKRRPLVYKLIKLSAQSFRKSP
jgi:hypothetical protein